MSNMCKGDQGSLGRCGRVAAFNRGFAISDASCLVGLTSKARYYTGDDSVLSTRELQTASGTHGRIIIFSICWGGLGAAAGFDGFASIGIKHNMLVCNNLRTPGQGSV